MAAQSDDAEAPVGIDAMDAEGASAEVAPPEESGICGRVLADAEAVGLDLTIRGPVEWPVAPTHLAGPPQVIVVARNRGTRSLTIAFPAIVGLADQAAVDTEPPAPVLMPTTVTLDPSEVAELPAGLPKRSCSGETLDEGDYTLVPVVQVEGLGHSPALVRGSALSVSHR